MNDKTHPHANDAIWAAFYRDGKSLGEIVETFGLRSVYDLSPWLTAPLTRTVPFEKYEAATAERDALRAALKRAKMEITDFLKNEDGEQALDIALEEIDAALNNPTTRD